MSDPSWKNISLVEALNARLGEHERAGFVISDGSIVEFTNVAASPTNEFLPDETELMAHIDRDDIVALWHTHPAGSSALSPEDFKAFTDWPGIQHIIVARDGIRFYGVKGRGVINLPGVEAC